MDHTTAVGIFLNGLLAKPFRAAESAAEKSFTKNAFSS
jgi:hypothetical protein